MLWALGRYLAIKLKPFSDKYPGNTWGLAIAVTAFVIGVIWRYVFIFHTHPIEWTINYSDMANYLSEMTRYFTPHAPLTRADTFYPPGASLLFGFVYHFKQSWYAISWLMFVLSSLAPLLIAAIAYLLYNRSVALVALTISSLYIAFVEFSGYLLSETPYIFFQLLAVLFLLLALRTKDRRLAIAWGLLAGLLLGWTELIRTVVLLPALFTAAALIFVKLKHKKAYPNLWPVLASGLVGLLPLLVGFTIRCSSLNHQFCLVSSNGATTVLQGHYYNGVGDFKFYDKANNYAFEAGDPAQGALGFTNPAVFHFGEYDQKRTLGIAKDWVKAHPAQAVEYSFEHIYNLFRTVPWPPEDTPTDKSSIMVSETLFRVFILLPIMVYLVMLSIPAWRRKVAHKSADLLVIAPVIGLFVLVFITVGNPRYRIPFDVFFIILAAKVYVLASRLLKTGWRHSSELNLS